MGVGTQRRQKKLHIRQKLSAQYERLGGATAPDLNAAFPHNDFVAVGTVGDLNPIFVKRYYMLVCGLDDNDHFFVIRIFKLDGMPFLSLDDLAGRWFLLVLKFLAVGVADRGNLAVSTGLTPKSSHPDRELQVAFLELHPDAGANVRNTQEALILLPAKRNAGHGPSGDDVRAQHAGDTKGEATKSFGVYVIYDKAAILPVESAFNSLHEVSNDLF